MQPFLNCAARQATRGIPASSKNGGNHAADDRF
jgi:hypothetical protein